MLLAALTLTTTIVLVVIGSVMGMILLHRWDTRQQAMRTPLGNHEQRVTRLEQAVFRP